MAVQTFTLTVNSVNDAPSFTKGVNQTVNQGCGIQSVTGWATDMSVGISNESDQSLNFLLNNDNSSLFSVQPAIATNGTLTYTVADNTSGIATVTAQLQDSGGTENGGTDVSATQTFTIKICAQSGSGEILLSEDTFAAGKTSSTITFTYTAAAGGMENGKLSIAVPDGWSIPSIDPAAEGYTTASTGMVGIFGHNITISDISISSGDTISVTYGDISGGGPGATASMVKGLYKWKVKSAAMVESTLNDLNNSPKIEIVPAIVSETKSSVAVDKNNILADDISTATITVILIDDFGNTVSGHNVGLSQGSGKSKIYQSSISSDNNGKAVFTVSSYKAGTVTYAAEDTTDGVMLGQTAEVLFKPGINVSQSTLNLVEGGSGEYMISLVSQPDDVVTVTGGAIGIELSISPTYLIFDTDNWNTEQAVTITVADNSSKDGSRFQTVTNEVYSSDAWYEGLDFEIIVNIADNDTPGIYIDKSSVNVEEGGATGSYNVKLTTKPKFNVTMEIDCGNYTGANQSTITFTPDNWNESQEVTVSAPDNNVIEGLHTDSISHSTSSSDPDYDHIDVPAVTVNITDNDYDASLLGLVASRGMLTPEFASEITLYNINVENSADSITITPTATDSQAEISVNGTAVVSGIASFSVSLSVGKNTIEVKVVAQDDVTIKTYLIDVIRAEKNSNEEEHSGSDNSGGVSNSGNNTASNVQDLIVDANGNISMNNPKLSSSTNMLSVPIGLDTLTSAFKIAKTGEGGVTTVEINIPKVQGAIAYESTLPASFLSLGDVAKAIEIKTDIADVTLPVNMLSAANGAQNVSLAIAAVDKTKLDEDVQTQIGSGSIIELNLKLDGQKVSWSNEAAPVAVSIPYTPTSDELKNPEHITVWYIDGSGNTVSVPSGRYDPVTGMVTFRTTHFSKYAVVYVQRTFSDIGSYSWAKKQIEVLASKGIISSSEKTYYPSTKITRADYIMMLVRTLGLSADFNKNFDDIKSTDYYYKEIGIARKLGLTSGVGGNKFNPTASITRQDMIVLTEKALRSLGKISRKGSLSDLKRFRDKDRIAVYAIDSVAALVQEGLIKGGNDNINPLSGTTRAEAAVILYKIYNIR